MRISVGLGFKHVKLVFPRRASTLKNGMPPAAVAPAAAAAWAINGLQLHIKMNATHLDAFVAPLAIVGVCTSSGGLCPWRPIEKRENLQEQAVHPGTAIWKLL